MNMTNETLMDGFGRKVTYLRMSVTDRCDFRCVYCMDEEMTFVPREQVLTLEEMQALAEAFVSLGVTKIRLTGGEPLIRHNVLSLCNSLGAIKDLDELVLTTNASQLERMAGDLRATGIKRINISLDSLKEERFRELTRVGDLRKVLRGIDTALESGFERVKLNAVILKGRNDDEVIDLVSFALSKGVDISFIEEMPLGEINEHNRQEAFCSSDVLREMIQTKWQLTELPKGKASDGPSNYYSIAGSKIKVGFISPHSDNFCSQCNRVRVTAEGRLLLCLGNEHSVDLRATMRAYPGDQQRLKQEIIQAMNLKPERHYFNQIGSPEIVRFMNMTGG